MLKYERLPLAVILCVIFSAESFASTRLHYTGTIKPRPINDIGFAVPVGDRVNIDITFDPSTPNTQAPSTLVGDYLMSGGDTRFQITIGSHVSTPITSYRITTIVHGCCASDDQYNFLSYASQGSLMSTSFPGW